MRKQTITANLGRRTARLRVSGAGFPRRFANHARIPAKRFVENIGRAVLSDIRSGRAKVRVDTGLMRRSYEISERKTGGEPFDYDIILTNSTDYEQYVERRFNSVEDYIDANLQTIVDEKDAQLGRELRDALRGK